MSAFLLEVLVKSLALGAVALVCGMLLVKTPASVRRLFWLTAGLSMLVLPLLTTAVPKWAVLSDETPAVQVLWGQGPTPVSDATAAPVLPAPGAQPPSSLNPWLLLWASGTGLLLLRAGVGLIRVRRIIRNSAPCLDLTLNEAYANVANRIGLARKVELRLFDQICPCTAGLGIPVVLLPLDAANWTQAQIEATLAHELTHVRDSDWALQGLLEFMRALYWPNPLSWVVTEGFRRSAEQSADDQVLDVGIRPVLYAEHLVGVAKAMKGHVGVAMPMTRKQDMRKRLQSILDDRPRRARGLTLFTAALLLPLAALPIAAASFAEPAAPVYSNAASTRAATEAVYRTELRTERDGRLLQKPVVRQLEGTQASIMFELEKAKSITVGFTPNASGELSTVFEYQKKKATFDLLTGSPQSVAFTKTGYVITDEAGKVVKQGELKDFPTAELNGYKFTVKSVRDPGA